MGLDQYLERRHYVKRWDHEKPEEKHHVAVAKGGKAHPTIQSNRISQVTEEVAYWRKANAIHAWFVKHVQEGKDDCQAYYVSRDLLRKLKHDCDVVLAATKTKEGKVYAGTTYADGKETRLERDGFVVVDNQIAETVLPTKSGFFFGCTDYDDGYIDDLVYTSETISKLLAEDEEGAGGNYYYQASW